MKSILFIFALLLLYFVLSVSLINDKTYAQNLQPLYPSDSCVSQHWDKIVFKIANVQLAQNLKLPPNTELDIKVLDDPTKVLDIKQRVLEFLNVSKQDVSYDLINIVGVDYALICANAVSYQNPSMGQDLISDKSNVNQMI